MTTTVPLSEFEGEKVVLQLSGDDEKMYGRVEGANDQAIIFRPKGKGSVELIDSNDVGSIELDNSRSVSKLGAKKLKPVTLKTVKRHLLDRHGYDLDSVNGLAEESAFEFHENQIDHSNLGHYHEADEPEPDDEDSEES